ncbi:hypothetical protein GON03_17585 [Nocardioides sp. MAH-18]|uniref:Uncharacterized protein n=1 Tax=Nocardioides agri TaxID=2682843 RepID=A0A6L6XUB0_9ACTN|nr:MULTISPECIES: hypothetical protein [unclassified Nocardioides]MBA2956156.1 hypothetical protein [Nocardioides sp. CGMCC 1.13656]MVQ51001.1 hypothetical protein [Nocardioides sp. MAH-18]
MNPRATAEVCAPQAARPPQSAGAPYLLLAVAFVAATLGFLLSVRSAPLPGSEALTAEDAVDLVALLSFGVLGAELLRRKRAAGLGKALLLLAGLQTANYLSAGVGDAITDGEMPTTTAARLAWMVADTAFIASFFLLLYAPLALFPTGRLPSRRWRWLPAVAGTGTAALVLSILLAPGSVDDDNPATGPNPLGVDALAGATDLLEIVGAVLLALTLAGSVAAYGIRWFRYRGPRRRQLAWFSAGALTMVVGMLIELGNSLLVEVLSALVIFGTLLGGMAWPLLGPLGAKADLADIATTQRSAAPDGHD